MSENKKYIAFFTWFTVVFLVLTYVFSIINFSCRFLNSEFLVVAFGGLFASFGVILLAEIKKYFINKQSAEDAIFDILLSLYTELIVQEKNDDFYLENTECMVPDNLFSGRVEVINCYLNSLRRIDYSPIKNNKISKDWQVYRQKEFLAMNKHIRYCLYFFSIAINIEKRDALKKCNFNYFPNGKDHYVNIALKKIKGSSIERIKSIEKILDDLSCKNKKRYDWGEEKKKYQMLDITFPSNNPELKAFFEE